MKRQGIASRSGCALLALLLWYGSGPTRGEPPPAPAEAAPEPAPADAWHFFQGLQATYTWLPRSGRDGLGVSEAELSTVFGVALPGGGAPLKITPAFAARLWDGPDSSAGFARPDLPPRIYDLSLDVGWRPRLAEWLFADLGITPGLYGDFAEINEHTLRLRGRSLGIVAFSPQLQIVAGLLYVNRNNTKLLPAGGVLWSPDDATHLELVFPQPKVSRRLLTTEGGQWWGYVAGEFGGGAWEIERADGRPDSVDYRDIRVLIGLEHLNDAGVKWRAELGYVFGRRLDYTSATPDFRPGDTVLLRAGLRY